MDLGSAREISKSANSVENCHWSNCPLCQLGRPPLIEELGGCTWKVALIIALKSLQACSETKTSEISFTEQEVLEYLSIHGQLLQFTDQLEVSTSIAEISKKFPEVFEYVEETGRIILKGELALSKEQVEVDSKKMRKKRKSMLDEYQDGNCTLENCLVCTIKGPPDWISQAGNCTWVYAAAIAFKCLEHENGRTSQKRSQLRQFLKTHSTKLQFTGLIGTNEKKFKQYLDQGFGKKVFTKRDCQEGEIKLIDKNFDPWDIKTKVPDCEMTPAQRQILRKFFENKPVGWIPDEDECEITELSQYLNLDEKKIIQYWKNRQSYQSDPTEHRQKQKCCSNCKQKKRKIEELQEENKKIRAQLTTLGVVPIEI